jgi:hypothetical protein
MTSKSAYLKPPWCSEKVPVFVWTNRRKLAFGRANTWVRFNARPEGEGAKVQLFSDHR